MNCIKIIGILIGFSYHHVFSQNSPSSFSDPVFNVTVPDPNAAGFGKFVESPISLFTGKPSVTIPIYTIQLKNLQVPISLDYNSSGIRVDELASDIGLGWVLNAGGSIIQVVHDMTDLSATMTYPPDLSDFSDDFTGFDDPDYWFALDAADVDRAQEIDTEPDIFYYNFLNNSGKFVETFNPTGNLLEAFVPIPYSPLKITRSTHFKFVDDKGIIYRFEQGSRTTNEKSPYVQGFYGNVEDSYAWFMTDIVTPNGEVVTFHYDTYVYEYDASRYEWYFALTNGTGQCGFKNGNFGITRSRVIGKRLSRIETSSIGGAKGVVVEFSYDAEARKDIASGLSNPTNEAKPLKSIKVSSQGSIIREFDLTHDYVGCRDSNSDYNEALSCRLKLTSVQEVGKTPSYFTYYEDMWLAPRLSYAQDVYGYSNGIRTNTTLIPEGTLTSNEVSQISNLNMLANRELNKNFTHSFMLKDYIYPTGGYTRFTYEPKYHLEQETVISESRETIFSHQDHPIARVENEFEKIIDLVLPSGYDKVEFSVVFNDLGPSDPETSGTPTDSEFDFVDVTLRSSTNEYYAQLSSGTQVFNVGAGNYEIHVRNFKWDEVRVDWTITGITEVVETVSKEIGDGGVRVEKIEHYDSDGSLKLKRFFSYGSPTKRLPIKFFRYFIEDQELGDGPGTVYACQYKQVTATSVPPLWGNAYDPEVGYGKVRITNVDQNLESLITEYEFSTSISSLDPTRTPGFGLPIGYDWSRGLPLKTTLFTKNAETYIPIKEEVNEYYVSPESLPYFQFEENSTALDQNEYHVPGLRVVLKKPPSPPSQPVVPAEFYVENFKYVSLWHYLKKKTNLSHENSKTLQTIEEYEYDPEYKQIRKMTKTSSEGEVLETIFRRPYDYSSEPYVSMVTENILSPTVERQVINRTKNLIIGSELTEYDFFYDFKLPSKQYRLLVNPNLGIDVSSDPNSNTLTKWTSDFQLLTQFYYNDKGNLNNVTTLDNPRNYIWGYDQNHIVAVVENPVNGDIAYEGFENPLLGGWTDQEVTSEAICQNQLNTRLSSDADYEAFLSYQNEYLDCLDNPDSSTPNVSNRQPGGKTGNWSFSGTLQKIIKKTGEYEISLWAQGSDPITVKGVSQYPESSEWELLKWTLTLGQDELVSINTGTSLVDDVRLHLHGAQMTSYTWSPGVGITSKMDPNHQVTSYSYDEAGRLDETRDQEYHLLNEYEYIYKD